MMDLRCRSTSKRLSTLVCFLVLTMSAPSVYAQTKQRMVLPSEVELIPDSLLDREGLPRIIRRVTIDRRDVFDSTQPDWFFAAPILNAVHTLSKEYLIQDELLLGPGDEIDPVKLLETERVLRGSRLFSNVSVTPERVGLDSVDIRVVTRDQWSLRPDILFGTGGGITNVGLRLSELNLFGAATQVMVQGLYRTENEIGWEGAVQLSQRRLFRSQVDGVLRVQANRFRTDQRLEFTKPYRNLETPWAFSVRGANAYGSDFAYLPDTTVLLPFHERDVRGWISQAYGTPDRLFMSASARLSDIRRTMPASRQAFDNAGHLLVGFASIRQSFTRSAFLDGYETEDVMEGGWGSVTLGRVFASASGGQSMWYVAGTGEQSWFPNPSVYLFGSITAGSGFAERAQPRYTYLEVQGLGHWRMSDHLVVAARLRSQTAWNWQAYRQLILDFESGLRGYDANKLAGDNRMIGNVEVRWFPQWKFWVLGVSTVAFYDIGSVWNQGVGVFDARFRSAVGLGFRLHNLKASGGDAIFRFDFAYNLDERKFSGLIFSTNQLFTAFGRHQYRAPDLVGYDIDER